MNATINLDPITLCEYKSGSTGNYTLTATNTRIICHVEWVYKNNRISFKLKATSRDSAAFYSSSYGNNIFRGNQAGSMRLGVNGTYTVWRFCVRQTTYGSISGAPVDGFVSNPGTYSDTPEISISANTSPITLTLEFQANTTDRKTVNFTPSTNVMARTTPQVEYYRDGANVLARVICTTSRLSTAYSDSYAYTARIALGSASESVALTIPSTVTSATSTSSWVNVPLTTNTAEVTVTVTSTNGGSYSGTRTATLDVPAMSSLSCSSTGTLGENFTISITRYDSTFVDTLTYMINDTAIDTIVTGLTGDSAPYTWSAPPVSLASYATSSQSVNVTIRCTTESSGGTTIGSTDVTVAFSIPATVVPTLGTVTVEAVNSNATVRGWGIYLQNYSACRISITGSAGIYGSTIVSYAVSVGNLVVNGTMSSQNTAWDGTSDIITASGSLTVRITMTDSRGRTAEAIGNITVQSYGFPMASGVVCHRTDQATSSAESDDGTYIYMLATLNYSTAGNHNAASMTMKYREADSGGGYSTPENVVSGVGGTHGNGMISVAHSYDVVLTVIDSLGNGNTYTFSLPTGLAAFHIRPGGTGVCIGGYSTNNNMVEIADRMGFVMGAGMVGTTLPSVGIDGQLFYRVISYGTGANVRTAVITYVYWNNAWQNTLLANHPIGSYYWSDENISPADLFGGGTWQSVTDTFIIAAGSTYTAGSTGGEATHTLTVDEMPAHTHGEESLVGHVNAREMSNGGNIVSADGIAHVDPGTSSSTWNAGLSYTSYSHHPDVMTINATHEHDSVGGGSAHNNMPPYIAAYCWRRTA